MNTPADSVATVREVADYLRVNQWASYRLAIELRIPYFKVGTNWSLKRGDADVSPAMQSPTPASLWEDKQA